MTNNQNRYFIELQLDHADDIPRNRESEMRRAQAADFISQLADWLSTEELKDKVASMAITALGQVQITCEQDIINRMQSDADLPIATIRQSVSLADSVQLIGNR